MKAQPLIAVHDVEVSSRWYQQVLGAVSGHGGREYEQLLVDGEMVLQLHLLDEGHHHGAIGNPQEPLGNGVALWFFTSELDAAVGRVTEEVTVVEGLHDNPNAGHRELWLRDPDGYLVVLAGPEQNNPRLCASEGHGRTMQR